MSTKNTDGGNRLRQLIKEMSTAQARELTQALRPYMSVDETKMLRAFRSLKSMTEGEKLIKALNI